MIHKVEIRNAKNRHEVIKQISCGAVFSVALSVSGDVFAWGSNKSGQMGQGPETSSSSSTHSRQPLPVRTPTQVLIEFDSQPKKVSQILAGDCHVLAADTEGSIFAWGQGQILEDDGN